MECKFKPGDKLICKSNEYSTIKENQRVTVEKYVIDGYFYIEEMVGSYDENDFIKEEVSIYKRIVEEKTKVESELREIVNKSNKTIYDMVGEQYIEGQLDAYCNIINILIRDER